MRTASGVKAVGDQTLDALPRLLQMRQNALQRSRSIQRLDVIPDHDDAEGRSVDDERHMERRSGAAQSVLIAQAPELLDAFPNIIAPSIVIYRRAELLEIALQDS